MSAANEYPLGGDLTDDRVSGLLHTTLERLANRTARQDSQLTQIFSRGEAIALSVQTFAPAGTDWRDTGQGDSTRKKITDISFGRFHSTWVLYSASLPDTITSTDTKYKTAYSTFIISEIGLRTRTAGGALDCQPHAERHRGATVLNATNVIGTSYIQGQIRGLLPGRPDRKLNFHSVELDINMKAVGIAATRKIICTTSVHNTTCDDITALVSTVTNEEVENVASPFAPLTALYLDAGTAKSQQYDTQYHSSTALGKEWKGKDLFVMDVKIYTDDTVNTLTELEVGIGELRLDIT